MSKSILGLPFMPTLVAFNRALNEGQRNYVTEQYRGYIRVALGRPYDHDGGLYSDLSVKRPHPDGHLIRAQTCMNMDDNDCAGIVEAYSSALIKAFGSSGYPFGVSYSKTNMSLGSAAPSAIFLNPVRLAWMMGYLGVTVDPELLQVLEDILCDTHKKGFSKKGGGLCKRMLPTQMQKLQTIFAQIDLSQTYPFGRNAYDSCSVGLNDPRRYVCAMSLVLLGHWQQGTIDLAPVPGSLKWIELLNAAVLGMKDEPEKLRCMFFNEAFALPGKTDPDLRTSLVWARANAFEKPLLETLKENRVEMLQDVARDIVSHPLLLAFSLALTAYGVACLGVHVAHDYIAAHLAR